MKVFMFALLAFATVAGLSACRITTYGGYVGSGVYHDDHYYPGWGHSHSHNRGWDRRQDNWNQNRL